MCRISSEALLTRITTDWLACQTTNNNVQYAIIPYHTTKEDGLKTNLKDFFYVGAVFQRLCATR